MAIGVLMLTKIKSSQAAIWISLRFLSPPLSLSISPPLALSHSLSPPPLLPLSLYLPFSNFVVSSICPLSDGTLSVTVDCTHTTMTGVGFVYQCCPILKDYVHLVVDVLHNLSSQTKR